MTRNTYTQEYGQLSGGERTSIALAYRLAFNTIVREVSFEKPIDLLILDEPTEGFSKEQLFKLRGVRNTLCDLFPIKDYVVHNAEKFG